MYVYLMQVSKKLTFLHPVVIHFFSLQFIFYLNERKSGIKEFEQFVENIFIISNKFLRTQKIFKDVYIFILKNAFMFGKSLSSKISFVGKQDIV